MIKIFAVFGLLAILVMGFIALFQNTSNTQKLVILKVVWYGFICSAVSAVVLSVIVLLF